MKTFQKDKDVSKKDASKAITRKNDVGEIKHNH
jgi:hypothetical protein